MSLLGQHLEENVLRLPQHVLISSNFSASGHFHEQTDSVTMGLPLSLVITSFFMEEFEKVPLHQAAHGPLSPKRLRDFLDHLNSVHQNIQFSMEMKRDSHLPFLDTLDTGIYWCTGLELLRSEQPSRWSCQF
jgi:hypothetical protein